MLRPAVSFISTRAEVSFDQVDLPDGLSWLFIPVNAGHCAYKDLIDGSLTLYDVALMIDNIKIEGENKYRLEQAMRR